jgi:hypothetical protein
MIEKSVHLGGGKKNTFSLIGANSCMLSSSKSLTDRECLDSGGTNRHMQARLCNTATVRRLLVEIMISITL